MSLPSRPRRSPAPGPRGRPLEHRLRSRPLLEPLEGRTVPSTFWVTNTLDAGPGSLRQAVLAADAHPGSDDVRFKHSAEGTITLTAELDVTGDLTVHGPGAADLTVSGGGVTRVFNVAAGTTARIADLTVAGGLVAGSGRGAGILNSGTLTLEDSVVTGNTAPVGAGIENTGALTVERSRVVGNRATGSGGGLHNAGTGTAVIDRSSVSDNTCAGDGAGIRSEVGTTLTLTDSVVGGNSATGFGTGGIASGATLTVRGTLIRGNTSAAAGMYLFGFASGGDVLISHSVIRDNGSNATSGSGAGGIWSRSSGSIKIEDTAILGNTGGSLAGGVYGSGVFEITDSIISGNTGGLGGGLYVFQQLTLTRSTVSGNTGSTGGVRAGGPATIVESTISGNAGTAVGGVTGFQLDLIRSTVSGNTAAPAGEGYYGYLGVGGVLVVNGHIQNSTVSGNTVLADQMHTYYGQGNAAGGIFASGGFGGAAVAIENTTVAFNRVTGAPADIRTSGGVAVAKPFGDNTYPIFTDASVRNTIIARNVSNVGGPDVTGDFDSGGHNLIGVLTADASGFAASDLRGTADAPLDPRLGPLRRNGGPTETHALAPDSPALNTGDNAGAPATDQRGRPRISGGVIDIGAYEAGGHDGDDGHGCDGEHDHDGDHHDSHGGRDRVWPHGVSIFLGRSGMTAAAPGGSSDEIRRSERPEP